MRITTSTLPFMSLARLLAPFAMAQGHPQGDQSWHHTCESLAQAIAGAGHGAENGVRHYGMDGTLGVEVASEVEPLGKATDLWNAGNQRDRRHSSQWKR